jgi:hypothetical protein
VAVLSISEQPARNFLKALVADRADGTIGFGYHLNQLFESILSRGLVSAEKNGCSMQI